MGDLLEREAFLDLLRTRLSTVRVGEGHCLFLSGESGIGKTSLVRAFCKELDVNIQVLQGACDAFFTPRPLAPIFDIALQLQPDFRIDEAAIPDSIGIFTKLLQELLKLKKTCIIIFEDIHWADEATLDFIRFLARRISQLRCLFILTYRDNEISFHHPLRNVFGQLPSGIFSRVRLTPLSKEVVKKLSEERGYNGDEVYSVTNGNPFYVNEILASYSPGVPDNIKDSVLSVYNRQEETTKQVWEVLSVIPTAFGIKYLEKLEPQYAPAIEQCLESQVLIIKEGAIFFKHELFRRAIEIALSPFKRVSLNRKIISLLQESFAENGEIERIIHHAKNANDYETVVHYAPLAAKKAATLGAHIEAARLYLTAIEYYQGSDKDLLIQFYEGYAYESYLT
ncbi:MAG TPA: AAA family ATPase, partial [Chitinophagaceae bacterium]